MNKKWSGRGDSNSRPPEPHSGALARLRYAPTPDSIKKQARILIVPFMGFQYLLKKI